MCATLGGPGDAPGSARGNFLHVDYVTGHNRACTNSVSNIGQHSSHGISPMHEVSCAALEDSDVLSSFA